MKLDVWEDERRIGTVWSDRVRPDLTAAGKGNGDVAFHFAPSAPLHGDPAPRVRVTPAGAAAT
ncbi:MAG TPA: hypothetical protein VFS37_12310, partial [Conexibacter sp.]|nr:hypothetical protein [Conexibacter sp.]